MQLLDAMRAEPTRIFTSREAAAIMGCKVDFVAGAIKYALANKAMFCRSFGRGVPMLLSGSPIPVEAAPQKDAKPKASQTWKNGAAQKSPAWLTDPDDPRIGKVVPGWQPPLMRHVRGGQ